MRARLVAATVILSVVVLVLSGAPAAAQEPTTAPEPTVSPEGPGGDLEGEGASLRFFVALSLLGGATALAMVAVQWFRTRPPGRHSD